MNVYVFHKHSHVRPQCYKLIKIKKPFFCPCTYVDNMGRKNWPQIPFSSWIVTVWPCSLTNYFHQGWFKPASSFICIITLLPHSTVYYQPTSLIQMCKINTTNFQAATSAPSYEHWPIYFQIFYICDCPFSFSHYPI